MSVRSASYDLRGTLLNFSVIGACSGTRCMNAGQKSLAAGDAHLVAKILSALQLYCTIAASAFGTRGYAPAYSPRNGVCASYSAGDRIRFCVFFDQAMRWMPGKVALSAGLGDVLALFRWTGRRNGRESARSFVIPTGKRWSQVGPCVSPRYGVRRDMLARDAVAARDPQGARSV